MKYSHVPNDSKMVHYISVRFVKPELWLHELKCFWKTACPWQKGCSLNKTNWPKGARRSSSQTKKMPLNFFDIFCLRSIFWIFFVFIDFNDFIAFIDFIDLILSMLKIFHDFDDFNPLHLYNFPWLQSSQSWPFSMTSMTLILSILTIFNDFNDFNPLNLDIFHDFNDFIDFFIDIFND